MYFYARLAFWQAKAGRRRGNGEIMHRRQARETAFGLIYAAQFQMDEPLMDLYANAQRELGFEDDPYVRTVFFGTCEKMSELDEKILASAKGWTLKRMPPVSLAIMRLAMYEMLYCDDVPFAIAVNEAVELAKKYDDEKAPAFINGVLNAAGRAENLHLPS